MYIKKIILLVAIITMSSSLFSQEKTAEELAKMAQNPLANMMSFPFQNNTICQKVGISLPSRYSQQTGKLPMETNG